VQSPEFKTQYWGKKKRQKVDSWIPWAGEGTGRLLMGTGLPLREIKTVVILYHGELARNLEFAF
jgi:hypothetical protein